MTVVNYGFSLESDLKMQRLTFAKRLKGLKDVTEANGAACRASCAD